ncbi:hypothetical protein [Brucella suis]|uniref:Uncharacterized protein n=1 Tax=Brucella suis (strain ATCC 23445 / NCTC 10510) TaxID=470137 RepID=A9WY69_BRUSI|nr:hypothetical protein [Brucella suis]ABY39385.1 Hypothetical protein, conserved [Brucella suis ATCC 23445]ENR19977.1 hypothetical protein C050_02209 [Brucella suis 92/63]ENR25765.1 hypothetical protein C978_02162 [Brucella suis 94/11]ENR31631.1 hypothetical protein C977_02153 [Brucella suis F4/06-146]ENR32948.1 hypothetical protein C006_02303 [Brucella suis F5/03-2]
MISIVLLGKYGVQDLSLPHGQLLYGLLNTLRDLDARTLMLALAEVVATTGDLRARVNPKYRFDERLHDLTQCLLLDGYIIKSKMLVQTDPSIIDAAPLEDDLIDALQKSGAPRAQEIIAKINDSAGAFRSTPPDYNASLVNARVALETLAGDVAAHNASQQPTPPTYNPSKWGEVLVFLRSSGEITVEEEKGLAGVFGFLSPGAHRPMGIPEDQMTRLGRSFALNMCWFLLKNHLLRIQQP